MIHSLNGRSVRSIKTWIMNQQTLEKPGLLMCGLIWLMPKMTPTHGRLYRMLGGRFVNRATGGAPG
jgi:hypothetical protein